MTEVIVANAITLDQTAKLGDLFTKIVNFIVNLFFSIVDTMVALVTQPAVLSALAFLAVLGILYTMWKRKRVG
ncbi:MAG: hypothetical protein Q9M94_05520 [Candidatus Gracilibacteria bacterium]|nr:hypothetical protein [Candidatus Gracilibacteria bacterium]MDQ7022146.1 hypothetical protein [Candidatus Gracilibacteria bacterium]